MDPFDDSRLDLTGTFVSMEFMPSGRISQLWASDPSLPEEGEDFQFIIPPLQFGEENAEDYFPGTILLGVRTDPNEPWVVSRNASSKHNPENEDFTSQSLTFEYDFPLIDQLAVTGHFHEIPGKIPLIAWDVTIKNTSNRTIEVGEVGFPLAFNNFLEGFGYADDDLKRLWNSRLHIHKFIGGACSWLFAERMTAEAPSLVVFPGDDTSWEFYSHVRGSLNTPYGWEGIPVVYAHSKATIEREEWPTWFNEHTSLILEPGDERVFRMRLAPTENDKVDGLHYLLNQCGKQTIKILPSAVAPIDVGIALEVNGFTPKNFFLSRDAHVEIDTDENGGFCFVKPSEPGPLVISFHDQNQRFCHAHLMFTEPINDLIQTRANWITSNQLVETSEENLKDSIVPTHTDKFIRAISESERKSSAWLECSLADALFLAEKNARFPQPNQIKILDNYIENFLLDDVQNPSNGAVASIFLSSKPTHFGRPMNYVHVANLYSAMARISEFYGSTTRSQKEYLRLAVWTIQALFKFGWRLYVKSVGILGFARFYQLVEDLKVAGMLEEAQALTTILEYKALELNKLEYPFAGETALDTSGFEEVFHAALFADDDSKMERTMRCSFASKSISPSWWWYGGDKRPWDGGDSSLVGALVDRGEACLGHTTIPNSLIFFSMMDRDYLEISDNYFRKASGGMLGPWSLIRHDGAASLCYCPDLSSKQAGYNPYTGAGGLGYAQYLREVASYVFPIHDGNILTFGCHYADTDGCHIVQPWDGVGRKIVMRQIGVEIEFEFGVIKEFRVDHRLRWFECILTNPSDKEIQTRMSLSGLWEKKIELMGTEVEPHEGKYRATFNIPASSSLKLIGKALPSS